MYRSGSIHEDFLGSYNIHMLTRGLIQILKTQSHSTRALASFNLFMLKMRHWTGSIRGQRLS